MRCPHSGYGKGSGLTQKVQQTAQSPCAAIPERNRDCVRGLPPRLEREAYSSWSLRGIGRTARRRSRRPAGLVLPVRFIWIRFCVRILKLAQQEDEHRANSAISIPIARGKPGRDQASSTAAALPIGCGTNNPHPAREIVARAPGTPLLQIQRDIGGVL